MICGECGAELEQLQRFCTACGSKVPVITGTSELPAPMGEAFAAPQPVPAIDIAEADPGHQITIPVLYDLALDEPQLLVDSRAADTTDQIPTTVASEDATWPRARIGVVVVLGLITGVTALVGMSLRLIAIRTDSTAPLFPTGDRLVSDLGTNLPGALITALVALLIGLAGAAFRQRWGYGLAAGSALAVVGWAALTLGLAERPVNAALGAVNQPATELFTVTVTRDAGYVLILIAAVGGLLTFLASLPKAGSDGRRSLNPWIAALGGLAAVIAAAGPLLPEGAATLQNNWMYSGTSASEPAAFLAGRLVQSGLLLYTGVIGFLLVRRYGLALAIGGFTAPIWLVITTLLRIGASPVGPGYNNPGSDPRNIDLHSATVAGFAALAVLAILGVISAYDQAAREP
jgi:hypothetical protein